VFVCVCVCVCVCVSVHVFVCAVCSGSLTDAPAGPSGEIRSTGEAEVR